MADENAHGDIATGAVVTTVEPQPPLAQPEIEEATSRAADLVVPFKVELDGELCVVMMQSLVQYLLYLRGQTPCIYDEFHGLVRRQQEEEDAALAAGTRKRKLVGGNVKKARKFVVLAEQMFRTALVQMFQRRVLSVVIVFGTTVQSPREMWRIDFEGGVSPSPEPSTSSDSSSRGGGVQGKQGATLSRERVVRLCVQKLIRTVLSYATQYFSSPLAITSVHLLVLAQSKSEIPLDGFVPKQQLRLREPKERNTGKRTHTIMIQHGHGTSTTTSSTIETTSSSSMCSEDGQQVQDNEYLWYQSVRPLQGLSRFS